MDKIRAVLNEMPGVVYSFPSLSRCGCPEMIIGVRGDVAIKVFGPDLTTLNDLASQIVTLVKEIPGNQDVYTVESSVAAIPARGGGPRWRRALRSVG